MVATTGKEVMKLVVATTGEVLKVAMMVATGNVMKVVTANVMKVTMVAKTGKVMKVAMMTTTGGDEDGGAIKHKRCSHTLMIQSHFNGAITHKRCSHTVEKFSKRVENMTTGKLTEFGTQRFESIKDTSTKQSFPS